MHISEEAILPAGEREESHWRCHPNVDADIPCLYLIAEFPGSRTTAGEEASHIAIGGSINQGNCFVNGLHMCEAENWPKDLGTGNFAKRVHIVQERRADEIATLIAWDRRAASIHEA